MFRPSKINDGITQVCGVLDALELSLVERWWVFSHLEMAARKVIEENGEQAIEAISELREKWGYLEVPVELVGGDGVGDDGERGANGDDADDGADNS